jgi:selenocysteine lyase/cysteine desulfurase
MLPDKYESGTINGVGIAGLGAGIRWVLGRGVEELHFHERALTDLLIGELMSIPGVSVFGPGDSRKMTSVVSCRVEGKRVSEVGLQLDDEFDILCRVGLHCAPSAHRTLGTFPEGTVRLAPGAFTSLEDLQKVLAAMEQVAKHG